MNKFIYMDGFGEIGFQNGLVRIDLVNMTSKKEGDTKVPVVEVNQQIVTSVQGLLISFKAMADMINKLEEAGVIKKNKPEE